ncbi:hypothetical protein TCON_1749 [Astathelohania contejeani]|uniref:Uncharacterized protein n=1 Tax=Astathelohania contejeani TaxID=164912 RepID=A0ABQ7HY51_9MICR|nr:hypothetical protein TCON_1749 [Thelohania contejeani]
MIIFFFFLFILCDNIQISKKEFKTLKINDKIIESHTLPENTSVKISFPGYYVYKLIQESKGNYVMKDFSVYIRKPESDKLCVFVEVENLYFGLADFVWRFIVYTVFVVIIGCLPFFIYISKISEEHAKND